MSDSRVIMAARRLRGSGRRRKLSSRCLPPDGAPRVADDRTGDRELESAGSAAGRRGATVIGIAGHRRRPDDPQTRSGTRCSTTERRRVRIGVAFAASGIAIWLRVVESAPCRIERRPRQWRGHRASRADHDATGARRRRPSRRGGGQIGRGVDVQPQARPVAGQRHGSGRRVRRGRPPPKRGSRGTPGGADSSVVPVPGGRRRTRVPVPRTAAQRARPVRPGAARAGRRAARPERVPAPTGLAVRDRRVEAGVRARRRPSSAPSASASRGRRPGRR